MLGAALLVASNQSARRRIGVLTLGASLGAAVARFQLGRLLKWQPAYRVELGYGRLEIRRYGPEIRAETTIASATWAEAMIEGVARLNDYASGGNDRAEVLPPTVPLLTTLNASGSSQLPRQAWRSPRVSNVDQLLSIATRTMAQVLPGSLTLDDLPAPNDERVQLLRVPARRVAALRFRGSQLGELAAQKRNELLFLTKCAGLRPISEVVLAAYDDASTLPLLRRNEVLVEVED